MSDVPPTWKPEFKRNLLNFASAHRANGGNDLPVIHYIHKDNPYPSVAEMLISYGDMFDHIRERPRWNTHQFLVCYTKQRTTGLNDDELWAWMKTAWAKTVCFQVLAHSNDAEKEKEMKANVLKFYHAQEHLLKQQYDENPAKLNAALEPFDHGIDPLTLNSHMLVVEEGKSPRELGYLKPLSRYSR
jgi:hypothetical protein